MGVCRRLYVLRTNEEKEFSRHTLLHADTAGRNEMEILQRDV
jgi:hypothetical protein